MSEADDAVCGVVLERFRPGFTDRVWTKPGLGSSSISTCKHFFYKRALEKTSLVYFFRQNKGTDIF